MSKRDLDLVNWESQYLNGFSSPAHAMQAMADRFTRELGMDRELALREAEDVIFDRHS